MIPEFTVTLGEDGIVDISFGDNVPLELAVWIKENLMSSYKGCMITPSSVEQIGGTANELVHQLVNQGVLYKGIKDEWKLKDRLINWDNPNESK